MRRFWPVSLTTRRRSGTGLKSTPNSVPLRAVNASPVGRAASVDFLVAAPVDVFERVEVARAAEGVNRAVGGPGIDAQNVLVRRQTR